MSSIEKIKAVALRIQNQKNKGHKLVVVVSAMGDSTDELLSLAFGLSAFPSPRELDCLLSTGETVSMSLLTIALNAIGCPAKGFCGYQAGIQTDHYFANASITEIQTQKISEALLKDQVVVVAGFQGQNSLGETTTLGRGGSDTTAVSLAAALKADRCEILKDVHHVYSADPRLVENAFPLSRLSYEQMMEMTFWGANVLQYRSVEIAGYHQVPLYLGLSTSNELGTKIENYEKEQSMIEDTEVLSVNSHDMVLQIEIKAKSLAEALKWLKSRSDLGKLPYPQILHSEEDEGAIRLFLTGPREMVQSLATLCGPGEAIRFKELSSVTATCRGSTRPETIEGIIQGLERAGIHVGNLAVSSMSITVFIERVLRVPALRLLHQLVPEMATRP